MARFQGLRRICAALSVMAAAPLGAQAEEPLRLFGAGSLREAMTEITGDYTARTGQPVETSFGYSGLMRERIEAGEPADIFTSANMGHPEKLLAEGRAIRVEKFIRNSLCVVAQAGTGLSEENVVGTLLDPALTLGMFPAIQDPVGDYTLELFDAIDAEQPGAGKTLRDRAVVIDKAMLGRPLAEGENLVVALFHEGRMGVHVSYCSTARNRLAAQEPTLEVAPAPARFRVGPEYGLAILKDARPGTGDLESYILSPDAEATLVRHGFTALAPR